MQIVDSESRLDLFRAKFSKANNELKEVKKREHNLKIELANKREKLKNAEDAFQRIVHEWRCSRQTVRKQSEAPETERAVKSARASQNNMTPIDRLLNTE